jgi:hypothetical protein
VSQFLVTVSTKTRRGRTNLHTFGIQSEAEHLGWFIETPASLKQVKERTRPGLVLPTSWPPPPRREIGTPYYDQIPDGPLHLAPGVDIAGGMLTVILDALRSDQRHSVDLDDIKVVVSQCGSHIGQLDSLGEQQRQHAEAALYREILLRCTRI